MYTPAAASLAARLSLREGFTDITFRLGGREGKWGVGLAWLYSIVVRLLACDIAWATCLAGFRQPLSPRSRLYINSAATNLVASLLKSATLGHGAQLPVGLQRGSRLV